jgi:hypothetical protein
MTVSTRVLREKLQRICIVVSLMGLPALAQGRQGVRATVPMHGSTVAEASSTRLIAGNAALTLMATLRTDHLAKVEVQSKADGTTLLQGEAFTIVLQSGETIKASDLHLDDAAQVTSLSVRENAPRLVDRLPGKQVCANLSDERSAAKFKWCAVVREGTNYLRQELTIQAGSHPLPIVEVQLFNMQDDAVKVVGSVAGSPLKKGDFFFGLEDPLSISSAVAGNVTASLHRTLPLAAGQSVSYSSVVGVAAKGQMRRSFLDYVEHERAHPYRTFLHYNSWYDLGFGQRYDEAGALDRVHAFGEELVRKRGVVMDSFLFDDGWDNDNSLWNFDSGFPDGFTRVKAAAAQYRFGIGVWLSPWGGYSTEKQHRVAFGKTQEFEIVKGGFALSGPKYYKRFEDVCLEMMTRYGVNQFKFDGTGNANQVFPGSIFDSDFSAAIHLIARLRQQNPDIFINLTTGTAASPFWLKFADSIWRGGDDHSFAGVGTKRQQWITYRDGQTYRNIVQKGPLYPLNSLMLHGIIYARMAEGLNTDPGHDFADEVHSYFGSGTQLQEMYITPSLLTKNDWDTLANAARWSRANAATLKDTHWVGGDPLQSQVYGWAAWNPAKSIITLRNPADHAQSFSLNAAAALELPASAAHQFRVKRMWGHAALSDGAADRVQTIHLLPFEVVTFELDPVAR